MVKKVLIISGFYPNEESPSSGQKIVYEKLKNLSKESDVDLVCFSNQFESKYIDNNIFDFLKSAKIYKVNLFSRILGFILYPSLPLIASARAFLAKKYVKQLLFKTDYDKIIVEFTQAAGVVPKEYVNKITFVEHDVSYQAYERRINNSTFIKKALFSIEYSRLKSWEQKIIKECKEIRTLNYKDKNIIEKISNLDKEVIVDYPKLGNYLKGFEREPSEIIPKSIMFWGHMARFENEDAVIYFLNEIFPLVLKEHKNAKFYVVGADPTDKIVESSNDENVFVTGYVKDPKEIFKTIDVAAVPLRYGAGIKIKTLETTELLIPTFSTSIGAEGVLKNEHLFIEDDPSKIASSINSYFNKQYA